MTGRRLLHYEVLDKLGEGGMGVVYKAHDTHLDRFVAIKVFAAEKVADPERKRRFVQEAKAASALHHSNIVTIHDIAATGGIDYIVMEHVDGKTLDAFIPRSGMHLAEVLKFAIQIASALAAAHAKGIIHRDLKPANVMITPDGTVKILDFGLAKLIEPTSPSPDAETRTMNAATEEGTILGTVAYMSPEQAEGKSVDARSDIFSFGCVLYEMLSGKRAFQRDSRISTLAAVIREDPEPLGVKGHGELDRVVSRCLKKDPAWRFQHMDDLRVALAELKEESGAEPPPQPPRQPVRRPGWMWTAAGVVVLLAGAGLGIWLLRPDVPPTLQWRRLTNDSLRPKFEPALSDGARVYFRAGNPAQLYAVSVSGGESVRFPFVPPPGSAFNLLDITPDGQELLIATYPPSRVAYESVPLWTVRIADGSSRRVGNLLGFQARYSPDGRRLVFTAGGIRTPGTLWVASSEGSNARKLLELKGLEIVVPHWAPDGASIAFGQINRASQERTAWEISAEGKDVRRLLPTWRRNHLPAGRTPDGRMFFTSDNEFWVAPQRRLFQFNESPPAQLSFGEPRFYIPIQQWRRGTFHALGLSPLGQLQRFDSRSKAWEPHLGGISADSVEYSRDGQSVAYVTHPQAELWVRRADGSRAVQVTKSPMLAWLPRWSPDDQQIAFMAKTSPDSPWKIYLVDASGGTPRPACSKECGPQGDLTWAPDGKKIVYALPTNSFYSGEEWYLRVLDLETGEVTKFPGSDGLFSPRWSSDGSRLAAVRTGSTGGWRPLKLYDVASGHWEELKNPGSPNWPCWSHDGRSLWYWDPATKNFMRFDLRSKSHEAILPLDGADMTGTIVGSWFNLTANDEPMILRRQDVVQIYAFEWKQP